MPGASALSLLRPSGPAEFETVAGPFLGAHEAENNLALGLTSLIAVQWHPEARMDGTDARLFVALRQAAGG